MSDVTGMSPKTIRKGLAELAAREGDPCCGRLWVLSSLEGFPWCHGGDAALPVLSALQPPCLLKTIDILPNQALRLLPLLTALIDPFPHRLARLEVRHILSRHLHRLPRPGIAAGSCT